MASSTTTPSAASMPRLLAPLERELTAAGIAFIQHTPNHIEVSFRGAGPRPLDDVFVHCRSDDISNVSAVAVSSSFRVPAACIRKAAELISLLNTASLLTGCFEMDVRDGEVRCRVSFGLWPISGDEATTSRALVDSAWGRAMMMCHSQLCVFLGLMEELLAKHGADGSSEARFNKLDDSQLKAVASVFEAGLQKVLGDEHLLASEDQGQEGEPSSSDSGASSASLPPSERDASVAAVAQQLAASR